MKKIILGVFTVVIVIFVWYGFNDNLQEDSIKIGVILPLTGKGSARGESTQQGLELALKKIANSKIKLIYQDASVLGGASSAVSAFHFLTEIEKVTAIIGPVGSSVSLAVTPLVDEKEIPVIVHTASAKNITKDNEYVFRLWTTAQSYADAILSEVKKRGYEKIAVISSIQDNTIDLLDILKEEISFVFDERVDPEEIDFKTILTKIKQKEIDALFLNLFEGQIGLAAKQVRELDIEVSLFTNAVMSAVELEVGEEILEGIWFPRFRGYTNKARQEFIEVYGKEPSNPESAASAHDALIVLAEAIKKVGTNPEKIKDYLYNNTFSGSIGEFRFLENGDAEVPLKIKIVRDNKIVDLEQ